ncbi:MAG: hypothetical protein M3Q93_15580 [Gemmatimonadota bacterium]|nr:hypothetical protein [Gemmatimonadota bacterium]
MEHGPRRQHVPTLDSAGTRSGSRPQALLAFQWFGSAFVLAAATAAIVNAASPFARGWWLVAFLVLVGGVSQVLLGVGQFRLAARASVDPGPSALLWAQVALWNAGTLAVAAADMAVAPAGVAAGSVVLMAALCLFLVSARRSRRWARGAAGWREASYVTLLVFLAASVVVGTFLADAVPGQ